MKRDASLSPNELELWVNQYSDELLRICYLILLNQKKAEMTVQMVFIKIYQKKRDAGVPAHLYVLRIAIQLCRKNIRSIAKSDVAQIENPVLQSLLQIHFFCRCTIILRYYVNLSEEEIAQILCMPMALVRVLLCAGEKDLGHCLSFITADNSAPKKLLNPQKRQD